MMFRHSWVIISPTQRFHKSDLYIKPVDFQRLALGISFPYFLMLYFSGDCHVRFLLPFSRGLQGWTAHREMLPVDSPHGSASQFETTAGNFDTPMYIFFFELSLGQEDLEISRTTMIGGFFFRKYEVSIYFIPYILDMPAINLKSQ